MSDLTTKILSHALAGEVRHRWIARNSGPDHHQWTIDGRAADPSESAALSQAYNRGLIGEDGDDRVRVGVRGRANLELAGAFYECGPSSSE